MPPILLRLNQTDAPAEAGAFVFPEGKRRTGRAPFNTALHETVCSKLQGTPQFHSCAHAAARLSQRGGNPTYVNIIPGRSPAVNIKIPQSVSNLAVLPPFFSSYSLCQSRTSRFFLQNLCAALGFSKKKRNICPSYAYTVFSVNLPNYEKCGRRFRAAPRFFQHFIRIPPGFRR